jgi:hypothetical protein
LVIQEVEKYEAQKNVATCSLIPRRLSSSKDEPRAIQHRAEGRGRPGPRRRRSAAGVGPQSGDPRDVSSRWPRVGVRRSGGMDRDGPALCSEASKSSGPVEYAECK